MEQYVEYLRKSRFDRDYADCSIEETLKRHKAILDKLASDRGLHIAKVFPEVVSGESIAARPKVQEMLEEVSAGKWAGVLVVDLERLARGNSADQAYISQVFQFSGTKIITPGKVYDPCNEFDEEYFEFGLFMSRREYKTIKRRLIRGRDSSAAEGKWLGSIAPYGYQRVKLPGEKGYTLEPDPVEADVIRKIFELYVNNNVGTKIIANYLNDNEIATRHGDLWTYSTIANIITNPVYMGKIRRRWSQQYQTIENGVVKRHIKRSNEYGTYTVYDGLHPALISEDTFLKAQELCKQKQPGAKVKDEFELQNAFAGLMFCSICKKRVGRTTGTVSRGAIPRLRCVNGRNCHNVSADYEVVEREIIRALQAWLDGYKVKIDTVGYADEITECKAQLDRLNHEAAKVQSQLETAYNLVEQGVYTLDLFQARREKLTITLNDLKAKREALEATIQKLESSEATQANLIPQTEALLASYDEMTNEERNAALKAVLCRIEYKKEASGEIIIDLYPRLPQA